ncbi:hypothetical protein BH09ACT10_BH09ACT10_12240 [soil metagenome]
MLDDESTSNDQTTEAPAAPPRRRAAGRPAGPPKAAVGADLFSAPAAVEAAPKAKRATKAPAVAPAVEAPVVDEVVEDTAPVQELVEEPPAKKAAARKRPAAKKAAAIVPDESADVVESLVDVELVEAESAEAEVELVEEVAVSESESEPTPAAKKAPVIPGSLMFQAPERVAVPARAKPVVVDEPDASDDEEFSEDGDGDGDGPRRRKRSRGGRRRRKPGTEDGDTDGTTEAGPQGQSGPSDDDDEDGEGGTTRRRRRRVRQGDDTNGGSDDPHNTVVRVREGRTAEDEITSVSGSTRLEAKKQRRREGREAGRRRAPIVSEAEFLARRESVKREMVVRQKDDFSQIAVLEDDVLVEQYVSRGSQAWIIGNVYLGRVQNVLPSMEAAFIDIGRGRNAVLYAGEVDWTTLGNGKQRKIEDVLTSGQTVLVQVTKDPIGQKGARLTSQISLAGRFLVYVPGGQTSGISRKLPDIERTRLKNVLKEVLPEEAGVIVRTAAEGATEDQLTRDVTALTARWEDIERKVAAGNSPELLYGEPDLMIKVVRDLFNEDFTKLIVEGDDAWDNISGYVNHVAPDLFDRLERWTSDGDSFEAVRVDEQISKALDRKVWLPSGGSLVIDRTEAMTVVDVNTGKFTGSGGNLEETVTKNNLEAAEEIVRQLRLRDIGGIIVIDFIDMVLEGNRDLVLRRLVECLGRDRTRHQVAEVTSLGLVQMTRKRIGTGLLESFSEDCDHCKGRGVVVHTQPVEAKKVDDNDGRRNRRGGRGNTGKPGGTNGSGANNAGANNSRRSPDSADPTDSAADQIPVHTPVPQPPADAPLPPFVDPAAPQTADEPVSVDAPSVSADTPVLTAEVEQP